MFAKLRFAWTGVFALMLFGAADCQPLHAQATVPPRFFCGVVGDTTQMQTTGGAEAMNFSNPRPTNGSVAAAFVPEIYARGTTVDPGARVVTLFLRFVAAPTEPSYVGYSLDYVADDGSTSTGQIYVVVFPTAESRASFLYYLQLQEQSATYADYVYATALVNYSFWLGQENQSLALYYLYAGLGDYYYLTTVDQNPRVAAYYYWYYHGLAAYYYYEGQGDLASASLAYSYYIGLANGSL